MSLFYKYRRGFTLIELMVTISIMLVILGTLVFNESHYSDGAALQNLADTIGLTIRQAQIYGISVKELNAGSNNFSIAYGVEFNLSTPTSYISFADIPQGGVYNGIYDGGAELITTNTITSGNTISGLCEIPTSGSENCSIGRIDITFLRPETNAKIVFFDTSGNQLPLSGVEGAQINVSSPASATNSVTVYTTGQISVK